ncbi:MAG: L-serine ammonia-lyase, iron-sulfur-dependent, subunit alpha [Sphaerochaetaceae bacterium]|jgi:L-cysteine desulfidase|nr:L-serine ammonia-lyase, iron-sulfur-dependent, subunit alpha [Sphaerochaetaceae bacterium]MDD2406822.1 L-serine ammonia-lyase, iron-sulfur-dependent, subunit alpha [Sphaerochaetaceae bacterium]MDD3669987.1 L-serine ammonia-lyase, iron-sulfur-dependent, subunit alpha [Sphaerochaetaceae bacterium]MDX9934446.1 L-serine ammonia-lyase, iron-sulfur-dependent, subunit alpha [Sphaerochaetaceae bacterium]
MKIQNYQRYVGILRNELTVAMGCTEPAASALAGAKVSELLNGKVDRLIVKASKDMVKNAMGVGLPNCTLKGIQAAVALGAAGGNPDHGLSILSVLHKNQIQQALDLVRRTELMLEQHVPAVYISVQGFNDSNTATAVIALQHERFVHLSCNGHILLDKPFDEVKEGMPEESTSLKELETMTLSNIFDFATQINPSEISFLLDAALTNMEIARHAMQIDYGLSVGKLACESCRHHPMNLAEAFEQCASYAAAASDARMAGCAMPVVINSGSGNQGITVSVPLLVLADYLHASQEKLLRALVISNMVALVLSARKDRLSALCGAFTAAIGAGCAMVYLLGGDVEHMDNVVNTMVANLTGIICDGAKATCALKMYSCVSAAALSCRLAIEGKSPHEESGIVGRDSFESIEYLSRITHEGMEQTDSTIVSIMLGKQGSGGC